MKGKRCAILFLAFFTALSGCSQGEGKAVAGNMNEAAAVSHDDGEEREKAEQMKEAALSMKEMKNVCLVKGKKQTVLAFQVYHRHRFRMEKIQKDLSEEMKKRFPDEKITVSYDFKIFLETSRLIHKIRSGTISGEKAEKEIGRIVRLNNEKT
ncbi:hypothetical protein [Caldibacillus debilis]|jgi:hypothetical protein|uniref:hypothetical protein n=1 Tax=Caldibacillus debilis TaxID=301148 RepID=UPI00036EAE17|nr:hypothetical protein [Caldibacillus debilis]MBO2482942.1 sporulation protein [Bacillaceae bacterium]